MLASFDTNTCSHRVRTDCDHPPGDRRSPRSDRLRHVGLRVRARAEYVHSIDGDAFIALVRSWSWVAILADDERAGVLARVRAMVGEAAELRLRYRTEVRWTQLA